MRVATLAVSIILWTAPFSSAVAAKLLTLDSGIKVMMFSRDELPTATNGFACDAHMYRGTEEYGKLTHGIYRSGNKIFGVFNACYLTPVTETQRADGKIIAIFVAAKSPYTQVAFLRSGRDLIALEPGTYLLKNRNSLSVDDMHRVVSAIPR